MAIHGCRLSIKRDGVILTVDSLGHPSPEDAHDAVYHEALDRGWTPPQWWEFWRWSEVQATDYAWDPPGDPRDLGVLA